MNQVQEMELQAVIFDFDGVIVDTEPLHWRAFSETLRGEGLSFTWEEYTAFYIGFDDRDAVREVFRRAGKSIAPECLLEQIQKKSAAFQRLIAADPPKPYPGVLDLLREISGNLPLALCSGALRSDIDPVFDAHKMGSLFDAVVTADDVQASKPDPAGYLRALELLNARRPSPIAPVECLAIEDTLAGIEAAKKAGMRVLAVSNSHPALSLRPADRVIESLENLELNDLQTWFSTLR